MHGHQHSSRRDGTDAAPCGATHLSSRCRPVDDPVEGAVDVAVEVAVDDAAAGAR